MKKIILTFGILLLFGAGAMAQEQTDGTLDISFSIGTGFNIDVRSIVVQPDGKILVGGGFMTYNGVTKYRIVRLNVDGSIDTSFNVGTGFIGVYEVLGSVRSIILQPDGKILVGGNFLQYNGQTSKNIVRLNVDGSLDTSFNIGTGFGGEVNTIAVQSDGKILVGGVFTSYSGQNINRIARLNTDGSLDDSFDLGTGFSNTVETIAIQPDGKILVGGFFSTFNGQASNRIARLNTNGSIDTSFNIGTGFNQQVYSIVSQPDGKILVGGEFHTYNGQTNKGRFVRLNTDGSLDTSLAIGTGFPNYVFTIALQSDNKILVGGNFLQYNGQDLKNIVRLNVDGSLDTSFSSGTGFNNAVNTIALQPDGKILAGGVFTSYSGQPSNRIVRLNGTGESNTAPAPPTNLTAVPTNSILLNWQDNSNNEDGFYIERTTDTNGTWILIETTASDVTTYTDTAGLTDGVEYFYRVNAFNSFGESSFSNTASAVEGTASVTASVFASLTMYPNPANTIVNFDNIPQNAVIRIMDMTGRIMHQKTALEDNEIINVSDLPSGMYIVSIELAGNKDTRKLKIK